MFLLLSITKERVNKVSTAIYKFAYIKQSFFDDHPAFIEMLDPHDLLKQTQRKYIFLSITFEGNTIFIPLRSILPDLKVGLISYPIPSSERPKAGLDYRKSLIINDFTYITFPEYSAIPNSQQRILDTHYTAIQAGVISYLKGYKKSASKNRHLLDAKYKYSTLHNFHTELDINTIES